MDYKKVCISSDILIKDAVQIINEGNVQIALVVGDNHQLIGTLTDGDVRRGIVSGFNLTDKVESIMNREPFCVTSDVSASEIKKLMKAKGISQVPVIDKNKKLIDLIVESKMMRTSKKDNWVVVMAGGLGERLGDLTKDKPKPLLKVGSKAILENILEGFIDYGYHKFYFTVNYKYQQIMDHFGDGSKWGVEIKYLKEEKRLGTAGSLSLLEERPTEPFIVMNGDLLTRVNLSELLSFHRDTGAMATMCVREYDFQVPYGVIQTDGINFLSIEEKPVQKYFVNAGIYILNPDVLEYVPKLTYYNMPTLFESLKAKGLPSHVFPIHEYWLDIGQVKDYRKANDDYKENLN